MANSNQLRQMSTLLNQCTIQANTFSTVSNRTTNNKSDISIIVDKINNKINNKTSTIQSGYKEQNKQFNNYKNELELCEVALSGGSNLTNNNYLHNKIDNLPSLDNNQQIFLASKSINESLEKIKFSIKSFSNAKEQLNKFNTSETKTSTSNNLSKNNKKNNAVTNSNQRRVTNMNSCSNNKNIETKTIQQDGKTSPCIKNINLELNKKYIVDRSLYEIDSERFNCASVLSKGAGRVNGVIFEGQPSHDETYYSETVLPGGGLDIPGRHMADDGTIRDGEGYLVVAADPAFYDKGDVLMTTLGPAKVYDTHDVGIIDGDDTTKIIDFYVNTNYFK